MSKIEKILIMVPVLIVLGIIGLFVKHQINYSKEFSSVEWKQLYENFVEDGKGASSYWDLAERKKMVKSLVESKQIIGKDKKYIIEFLGLEENNLTENSWVYWLDFRGMGESVFLKVNFDEEDNVIFAEEYDG